MDSITNTFNSANSPEIKDILVEINVPRYSLRLTKRFGKDLLTCYGRWGEHIVYKAQYDAINVEERISTVES